MRRILTFIALLLTVTTFAGPPGPYDRTSARISSNAYEEYEVRLNGRSYRINNNTIQLNDVGTGFQRLEVFRIERGSGGIFGGRDRFTSVYNNNINIRNGEQVHIDIDRSGRVDVREYNSGNYGMASLRVSSASYDLYEISIDGRSFRLTDNEFRFNNLTTGVHRLEAIRIDRRSNGIFGRKDRPTLVFSRNINVSSGENIELYINRNGAVNLRESDYRNRNNRNRRWGNDDDRDHDRGYGNDRKF